MAISFGLYSFLGIEMVAISSGEARSRKDVARATRIAFATLVLVYVGAMAVLVGVMPWKNAGVSESPFVTVFKVADIPAAGFIMNFVVLSAALSGANASLYVASRMLFALSRSGYVRQRMGVLNQHGVPMGALLVSMAGIVGAILLELRTVQRVPLHHQCRAGGRHDCVADFSAGACPLPACSLVQPTGGNRTAISLGRGWIDSWIHRDCGRDCLHVVGIAIERRRQERRDLSGGADGGVFGGEEEVGLLRLCQAFLLNLDPERSRRGEIPIAIMIFLLPSPILTCHSAAFTRSFFQVKEVPRFASEFQRQLRSEFEQKTFLPQSNTQLPGPSAPGRILTGSRCPGGPDPVARCGF